MRSGDAWGGPAPSAAAVLEMADGLRGHDPHLAAALVDHAVRLNAGDPSVRYAADLTSARALAERDAPSELAIRYAAELVAAREDSREADEVAWRVVLAGAALDLGDASTARTLLAEVADDAVAAWCRPELVVARARERAAAGDVESCDDVARSAGAGAGRGATLDLLRARAAARASSGDVAGAIDLLTAVADPPSTAPDADGGRRAAGLAADHVALLLDRGDVRGALDRAGPFLDAVPGPATAVALGRLADDVARRVHLPAGAADRAMALAARAENDLSARGQLAAAARAGLVLAEAAEAAGDLPGALSALRRAHAHELDAREAEHAATVALASVAGPGLGRPARRRSVADTADSTQASSGDTERRPVRGEGGRRREEPVEPAVDGADGSGAGVTAGSGGRRRRREENENTDTARAGRPPGGRHGRADDASSAPEDVGGPSEATSRSRPDAASSTRRPDADGVSPPGTSARPDPAPVVGTSPAARPVETVPIDRDDPSVAGASDDVLGPTAPARRPEDSTGTGTPQWAEVATDVDPARDVDDMQGRPPVEGEMSALDTLHRNALRLEVLLGRAGTDPAADEGAGAVSASSTPVDRAPRSATAAGSHPDPSIRSEPEQHGIGSDAGLESRTGSTPDHHSDLDAELPLVLVDVLAEYDLPDLRPAAAREPNGPERAPRASVAGPSQERLVPAARPGTYEGADPPGGWGPSGPDGSATGRTAEDRSLPSRRGVDDGPEADPGARLADLLAEAMDAFRRTEPRASQSPSVSTGPGEGRSPR